MAHGFGPGFAETLGRRGNRQPGDEFSFVIVDAGADTAHAAFGFFVVEGVLALTDVFELGGEFFGVSERVVGKAGEAGATDVVGNTL